MKTLVAVLSESPFYFTMPLRDRHGLVKRLASKQPRRATGNRFKSLCIKDNRIFKG